MHCSITRERERERERERDGEKKVKAVASILNGQITKIRTVLNSRWI
jgi:hypothetical protein